MSQSEPTLAGRESLSSAIWKLLRLSFLGVLLWVVADQKSANITIYFLAVQDVLVLVLVGLFFVALPWFSRNDVAVGIEQHIGRRDVFRFSWIMSIIVGCTVLVISRFAYHYFALSMDEFMAEFDARIIASGRLIASVAPEWRDYVPALQPIFRLAVPENAYWISSYLPVNAALRAVFLVLGNPALEGAVLAGVAVMALYGVARRLWPDRPDAAAVSVVLLVCSSQFLLTAATPYAMTAHLAFNLVWLWLFLRDTRASHVMAAAVGFAACGLHQVVFHPLFAAPFVLSLFVSKRWKLAGFYSAIYAISVLFWILYWSLVLRGESIPTAHSADVGIAYFIHRVADMLDFSLGSIGLMVANLLRFLTWQNPLVIPLALAGLAASRSRNAAIICLTVGIVATLGLVLVLMPFQGHGWGYRYLHGYLGSLSLIAAQGWILVTTRKTTERAAGMIGNPVVTLLASVAFSLLVLLPLRAYQVHAFVTPYAAATAAIGKSRADVVIVDFADVWYGADLVRNDPFLRASPKVMGLIFLKEAQLEEICRRYDVVFFDRQDALRLGIRIISDLPEPFAGRNKNLRDIANSLNCGRPFDGHS